MSNRHSPIRRDYSIRHRDRGPISGFIGHSIDCHAYTVVLDIYLRDVCMFNERLWLSFRQIEQ